MLSEQIFKRDANGSIRVWQGETLEGSWRSHTGLMGGATVTSEWSDAPARSQATDAAQAVFEMNAQLKKLLAKDYRVSVSLVDVPRGSFIKPMLAATYKTFPKGEVTFAQPKLDGMRCLANVDGLWSRGAKPINAAPHVERWLYKFFTELPHFVLDGELYNHEYHDDFNKLMSVARKQAPNEEELAESRKVIQFHIYDCYSLENPDMSVAMRQNVLKEYFPDITPRNPIQLVPTLRCLTEEGFNEQHVAFIQEGYEGSMLRLNKPYEQKRSKTLLKYKDFITEEFKLLGIEEGQGNWSGYAKRALCQTNEGVQFGAGIKGNQDFCKGLLETNPETFESVTIRHFGKTPDGSIRFPIAVSFNEAGSLENRTPASLDPDDTSDIF